MDNYSGERFQWSGNDITILDSNSNIVYDVKEYFDRLEAEPLKVEKKLEIGDVVSLKGRRYLVRVESLDYKLSENNVIDYVGSIVDFRCSQPIYFYQRDIEKINNDYDSEDLVEPIKRSSV